MTYNKKPSRLLTLVKDHALKPILKRGSYCAGFELQEWRCDGLAMHLIEWIADYALKEDELRVDHTNMYVKLQEAAVRIYTSDKYKTRGEIGEILLHAICRDFFDTIPIAPRVFYLTSANDVVKSFDMVHARYIQQSSQGAKAAAAPYFELWLGEAKLFTNSAAAVKAAISSIKQHIDQGFLTREKLLLGPQVSKDVPHYDKIRELLSHQTSLDALFETAVFPVCIASDSASVVASKKLTPQYEQAITLELDAMQTVIAASGLTTKIRIVLIYVPLGSKANLATNFHKRLKGLAA